MTDSEAPTTMYHDAACPVCALEVAHYRSLDAERRIRFIDVRAAAEELRQAGVDPETAVRRLHARGPDGRILTGARAIVAIWARLPGWRRIAPIAGAPPFIWMIEAGYRVISPMRRGLAPLFKRGAPR